MKVTVKYFALLREALERDQEIVELPSSVTNVNSLREWLSQSDEIHSHAFSSVKRIRAAVDGTMANDSVQLTDGCEVAFFPPVTGG